MNTMDERPPLEYIINHIFLPPRLPQAADWSIENDGALCNFVIRNAKAFCQLNTFDKDRWNPIIRMLENLHTISSLNALDKQLLLDLASGLTQEETLVVPVRAQNACVFMRRLKDKTIYEIFEVDPPNEEVMATTGRLIRNFPGPALETTNSDASLAFEQELLTFLADMDIVTVGSAPTTTKARSKVPESRNTLDPHYITELLPAIIHGFPDSSPADIERIRKCVRNEILWDSAYHPWRRSPLWLIIRVALQSTLRRATADGQTEYKSFMIFLLANIVSDDHDYRSLPTDILDCIRKKIARRLQKLAIADSPVLEVAIRSIGKAVDVLQARWEDIQRGQASSPPWDPDSLNLSKDTVISLLSSKDYLTSRLQLRQATLSADKPIFQPSEASRLNDDAFLQPTLFSDALRRNPFVALTDIEEFAVNRLDIWVENYSADASNTCVALGKCILSYADVAQAKYSGNAEEQSLKFLTIFLLWSALDRLSIVAHPMLADYSPEVTEDILDPILLRKSVHIEALLRFRHYLQQRHSRARQGSVFSDDLSTSSFSIRHFRGSGSLIALKEKIEREAQDQRDEKRKEYRKLKDNHMRLTREARSREHDRNYNRKGYAYHPKKCYKCSLEKQAAQISITVHEWPLPEGSLSAQATVFELQCPPAFQAWRSTTYVVLYDVCRPGLKSLYTTSAEVTLSAYAALGCYRHSQARITFASSTKSFMRSHYSTRKVADVDNVSTILVNNGLRYHLYDAELGRWAQNSFSDCNVDPLCHFSLPLSSPYSGLQYALPGNTHSANQPIADQALVPPALSVHEHLAFGSLRSGSQLQWLNILRELRARNLSFDRLEVHMLLIQATLQTGDISDGRLVWHEILNDPIFGLALLNEIDDLLSSVEDNWHHIVTLHTMAILTTRLLAALPEDEVVQRACSTLRTARRISFSWVQRLIVDLKHTDNEDHSTLLRQRLSSAAAGCRATYDVDSLYLGLLIDCDEDINIFIQCAIQIKDNTAEGAKASDFKLFLRRDARMAQNLITTIWERIRARRVGLDKAIVSIWSGYHKGSDWKPLPTPNERWLVSSISDVTTNIQSTVHYNLLDGTLLIDGKPLGRLPASILQHSTYVRLLGNKILDIVPSTLPSMDFATRNAVVEPNVILHFQVPRDDGILIIQAQVGSNIFELVPSTVFCAERGPDFPSAFIANYAHWLHLSPQADSGRLGFHPLKALWQREEDWTLTFTLLGSSTMTTQNGSVMVDIRSGTFSMLSKRLEPLDNPSHVHMWTDAQETLSLQLPNYNLAFFLSQNKELECSTIRDMVVDRDQSSGAFFGLTNQLVLRNKVSHKTRISTSGSRCVIVPFGNVTFSKHLHHSQVKISTGPSQRYIVYQIDVGLGRLSGSTMLSHLYKIYLHACTSFPLPDPLTQRTGTEEALNNLDSARSFSFQSLSEEETKLLFQIGDLTPSVQWYPQHLKVMQTIHWNQLGSLVQHWAFASLANEIMDFDRQMSSIGIGAPKHILSPRGKEPRLLARMKSRSFGFYPHVDKGPVTCNDTVYPSRSTSPSRGSRPQETLLVVSNLSSFAYNSSAPLDTESNLWERLQCVQQLSNELQATDSYRQFISPDLGELFLPLYELCQKGRQSAAAMSRFAFTWSTMLYTSSSPLNSLIQQLAPTFLAFARTPDFKDICLPLSESFDLRAGIHPKAEVLENLLKKYPLEPPFGEPTRLINESDDDYYPRRRRFLESEREQQLKDIVQQLVGQWPCPTPSRPSLSYQFRLFDLYSVNLTTSMSKLFLGWYNNMQLKNFVDQVQTVLDRKREFSISSVPRSVAESYHFTSLSAVEAQSTRILPPTLIELVSCYEPPAAFPPSFNSLVQDITVPAATTVTGAEVSKVVSLVDELKHGTQRLHHIYASALDSSLKSHLRRTSQDHDHASLGATISELALETDYELRRSDFIAHLLSIKESLAPRNHVGEALQLAGQWPSITAQALMTLLSKAESQNPLSSTWRDVFIVLAQRIVHLQRARRALTLKISGHSEDLSKELHNSDYDRDPSFHNPDWLLIQASSSSSFVDDNPKIDSNFTVRPVQSRVAQEMILPHTGRNLLTQLNMGEGKSSVIVPLVSSTLADGQRLVRVVTLKPLFRQTFDLLVRRLSGLLNRRVFYLPFSRDFKADPAYFVQLKELYSTCVRERGVLVIQPEHILSFRLMGVDLVAGTRQEAAQCLLDCYRWLTAHARDILDESDEILRVTYQLVYTSGVQQPMDNHPDRWTIIEEVLGLAQKHAESVSRKFPKGLEVYHVAEHGPPIIRILDSEAGIALIDDVISEVLSSDKLRLLPQRVRITVAEFIRGHKVEESVVQVLRDFLGNTSIWKHLLLYRGLLGHGLLHFALQEKRWRVDYGLDLSRTLLAVPYRAKDLPSLRADFGHPDVALILTCLSYYYGGLTEDQLDTCFELLFKLDDPDSEYNHWVVGRTEIPNSFRDIKGVNLDDEQQRKSMLGPLFRQNKAVVDFYLTNVVFPRYAKQFPHKLSTSSWDLAEMKNQVTTGFSGTNDNRYLLPTSIQQHDTTATGEDDPFGQHATNAKVLSILLRPENSTYHCLE
ncbi:hypothetical protein H0H93_015384, partial [Arthromyces matolae]